MALTWNDIKAEFVENITNNYQMSKIIDKMNAGSVTWEEANEYAIQAGNELARLFKKYRPDVDISEWNVEDLIPKSFGMDHRVVSEVSEAAQKTMNDADGIGIKVQSAGFDSDKAYGVVEELKANPEFTNIENTFYDQVINYSQSVVDDTIKKNAQFQSKSGVKSYIIRKAEAGACKWCRGLAGMYDYSDLKTGDDVWRRHENCRCTIEYTHDGKSDKLKNYARNETSGQTYIQHNFESIDEAVQYAKEKVFSGEYMAKVSLDGVSVSNASKIINTIEPLETKYGYKLSGIETVNPKTSGGLKKLGGQADAPFATNPLTGTVYVNKSILKDDKSFANYVQKGNDAFKLVMDNKDKLSGDALKLAETYEKAGKDLVDDSLDGMVTHEYGHYLNASVNPTSQELSVIKQNMEKHLISGYSQNNLSEYLAESFVEYQRGDISKLDPNVIKIFERAVNQ